MPIAAAPNRGYIDYQRTSNMDSANVLTPSGNLSGGPLVESGVDVSRFAYTTIKTQINASPGICSVSCQWFADPALTEVIGFRECLVDSSNARTQVWRVLNLGSFLTITWRQVGATVVGVTNVVQPTNRQFPLELVPLFAVVINEQSVSVAGGATQSFYPVIYYAGPIQVWLNVTTTGIIYRLLAINPTGTYDLIGQQQPAAGDDNFVWVTPPDSWRVDVVNTNVGAENIYLTVTATTTGST